MLNSTRLRDKGGPHRYRAQAAPRGSWIDTVDPAGDNARLARPSQANTGAGDTAQPRSWGKASSRSPEIGSRPSAIDFGRGEPSGVASRQASRRPQPPLARWGAKPRPPSEARLPLAGLRAAQVGPEGAEGTASSRAAQPKPDGRNDRAAQPQPGVAALCAAGPQGRRSRPPEAEGREGAGQRADAAYSRGSAGAAALAAGAKRRPARCSMHSASTRSYNHPFNSNFITPSVAPGCSAFEAAFGGAKS